MASTRSLVNRFRMRELKKALPPIASSSTTPVINNPFIPHVNPESSRWAPPRYSLRRQAELIKKARLEGKIHLLPPGPKLTLAQILAAQKCEQPTHQEMKGKGKERKAGLDINTPVEWLGELKVREPIGADVGNRLYAGKKQMFKGHKWERVIRRKHKYQRILMRDMQQRILRWRRHYLKRKPWPLSIPRVRTRESQKLPF